MIRRLRQKFIVAAMLSMFIVLSVLMAAVNVYNYTVTTRDADTTLAVLSENKGRFPDWMIKAEEGDTGFIGPGVPRPEPFPNRTDNDSDRSGGEEGWFRPEDFRGEDFRKGMSPELPFASRYFSALVASDGTISEIDTEHIAAVDADGVTAMAASIAASGKSAGYYQNYRYCATVQDGGVRITFLDCSNSLSSARTFLLASVVVSLLGLGAVFLMMLWLSGRFTRPMAESYEKQKRFITDAGHEIKTSITIIDADAELLSMDAPDNEWLHDIRAQTKRLAQLTNDLIFLSKMDEERPQLQMIDFPLSDMVGETAASFRSRAIKEGKTFTLDIQPMLTMCGDEKALCQLVNILTDNALKYSPKGGEVSLGLKETGKNAVLTVTNTCESIPEGNLNDLFDRFYRSDKSRSSSTGGHGLGLSIARAVVNAHKGRITVSAPDRHTMRFFVLLPMQPGK